MSSYVAILEDNRDRLLEIKACLEEVLPQHEHLFFDNAFEMIQWLQDHLPEVVLISLDHDLPIIQYRNGVRVDPGTGRVVADWLAGLPPTCPVIVHSSNEIVAPGMVFSLKDGGWPHTRIHPYGEHEWVKETWLPQVRKYVQDGWIFIVPSGTPSGSGNGS